jgi:hypothetical protein
MATIDNSADSFVAASSSGVAANIRVKLNSAAKLEVAGASDREIGVTDFATQNGTTPVKVKLSNGGGSLEVVAGGAITAGAVVKRAASGKVTADGAGSDFGIAYGSADGDGDVIVVYPL